VILAFSTSSPWASVALIDGDTVVWEELQHAPQNASAACIRMLEAHGEEWRKARIFAADVGPGSFTGVRVGVMLAKSFAFALGGGVVGANAFDLVATDETVALPSRRGEYFVRVPGEEPVRTEAVEFGRVVGYGPDFSEPEMPRAGGFAQLNESLKVEDPMTFAPAYLIEPSISIPKKPYRHV
jgi:tRNA threonylcarbamoyl adenosine modification protein YeaZ